MFRQAQLRDPPPTRTPSVAHSGPSTHLLPYGAMQRSSESVACSRWMGQSETDQAWVLTPAEGPAGLRRRLRGLSRRLGPEQAEQAELKSPPSPISARITAVLNDGARP
ncbi:unnamed protein product [Lota lota]